MRCILILVDFYRNVDVHSTDWADMNNNVMYKLTLVSLING